MTNQEETKHNNQNGLYSPDNSTANKSNVNMTKVILIGALIGLAMYLLTSIVPNMFNHEPTISSTGVTIAKNSDDLNSKEKDELISISNDNGGQSQAPNDDAYTQSITMLSKVDSSLDDLQDYAYTLNVPEGYTKTASPFAQQDNNEYQAIAVMYNPNDEDDNQAITYQTNDGLLVEIQDKDGNVLDYTNINR